VIAAVEKTDENMVNDLLLAAAKSALRRQPLDQFCPTPCRTLHVPDSAKHISAISAFPRDC
jgi:hypothetical protein